MKTIEQFKAEIGITEIKLKVNDKGRKLAVLPNGAFLLVSDKCNMAEDLYVNQITKDKAGNPITDEVYVVFNTKLKDAGITI